MFLGRRQLGAWVTIGLQCKDGNGTPSLPEDPPMLTIRRASDNVVVYNGEMPIVEKAGTAIGYFKSKIFLGTAFIAGNYNVEMAFAVGSFTDLQTRTFTIVAGGHPNGQVIGMAFFRRPNRTHVIYQCEDGRLLKGSNPKI
jgi:hypothetical protein